MTARALLAVLTAALPAAAQCPPTPEQTIVESAPAASEAVGHSVALSGNTLALSSMPPATGQGGPWSVHIFDRDATGVWTETAEVTNPAGIAVYFFGLDLALEGDTLFVGDPTNISWEGDAAGAAAPYANGVVHVFERHHGGPNAWGESQTLLPEDAGTAWFGGALAVDGGTLVITASSGGPGGNGAAYIYRRLPHSWSMVDVIPAFAGAGLFGSDVDVGPGRIVVGASRTNTDVGRVGVYEEDAAGAWLQTATLQPATQTKKLFFGKSVALCGDRIAVGAPAGPIAPVNSGRVRVYDLDPAGAWAMTQIVKPNQPLSSGAHFGTDVALSGDTLLASAPYQTGAPVWAFRQGLGGPNNWGESLKHTPGGSLEVVAVDGDRALIGSPGATVNGIQSGAGFLYEGVVPAPFVNYCTAGTSSKGCTPQISANGCPSATASAGFSLWAVGGDGAKPGLFLFSTSGRQATPWGSGNSLLCLASPVRRASLFSGYGTPGLCDGSLGEDLNALWCPTCPSPQKNPGAGTLVGAQFWSRTPPTGTGPNLILSDAIEFVVSP